MPTTSACDGQQPHFRRSLEARPWHLPVAAVAQPGLRSGVAPRAQHPAPPFGVERDDDVAAGVVVEGEAKLRCDEVVGGEQRPYLDVAVKRAGRATARICRPRAPPAP